MSVKNELYNALRHAFSFFTYHVSRILNLAFNGHAIYTNMKGFVLYIKLLDRLMTSKMTIRKKTLSKRIEIELNWSHENKKSKDRTMTYLKN